MTRDEGSPPVIDYATPAARERPTVALWVAAALVWAGAAGVLAMLALDARRGPARQEEMLIAGLVALAVARCEWHAVVGRSTAATWFIVAPAAVFATFMGVFVLFAAFAFGGGDDVGLRLIAAMAAGAATLFFVAIAHGRWAMRLVREQLASGEEELDAWE